MNVKQITPLICTPDLSTQKKFYETHFSFRTIFDAENYLCVRSAKGDCDISFMPAGGCGMRNYEGGSLTLCLHVDDVDKEHERLAQAGLTVVQPPTDNPWGDRSTMVLDPIGICLYLYKEIPMSREFQQYVKE